MVKVTIFTPTYNRGKRIINLYDSLKVQTCFDFEWIIVDQGNDETEEIINEIKNKCEKFPVRYKKITNTRGINRAFNYSINVAAGLLMMKVDDDDVLTPDAVELILNDEKTISGLEGYAGVSGLRMYKSGNVIGHEWVHKGDYVDATNLERTKYKLDGDKAEAYYVNVLKQFGPMPEFEGEYYTWEGVLWDRIAAAGYKLRWFNQKIYVTEYLPGGATANAKSAPYSNFKTYTLVVSEKLTYHEIKLTNRLKWACRYCEVARGLGYNYSEIKGDFQEGRIILLIAFYLSVITRHIKK